MGHRLHRGCWIDAPCGELFLSCACFSRTVRLAVGSVRDLQSSQVGAPLTKILAGLPRLMSSPVWWQRAPLNVEVGQSGRGFATCRSLRFPCATRFIFEFPVTVPRGHSSPIPQLMIRLRWIASHSLRCAVPTVWRSALQAFSFEAEDSCGVQFPHASRVVVLYSTKFLQLISIQISHLGGERAFTSVVPAAQFLFGRT